MDAMQQNADGTWSSAIPCPLMCEKKGCDQLATKDCAPSLFSRLLVAFLGIKDDWADEPQSFCEKHAKGRKVIRNT